MKKDFGKIKNIILLIASALTLVAVTFAWYTVGNESGVSVFSPKINSSTLSAAYYESDDGVSYNLLSGEIEMDNMYEGKTKYYRINVKTFEDVPIRLIMNFEGINASNALLSYVYFDYSVVCNGTGEELEKGTALKMSDYTSSNIFAQDISSLQLNGNNAYSVYYNVYVITNGEDVSGTADLGEIKIQGQQIS